MNRSRLTTPRQIPRGRPRFLVHSGRAPQLAQVVSFYRPVALRARLVRGLLAALLRVLGPRALGLVGGPLPPDTARLVQIGAQQLGAAVAKPIGGIVGGHGAPGPDRKVTLVALTEGRALPMAFAKLSATEGAAVSVRREADSLEVVASLRLTVAVPRLLCRRTVEGHEVVVLSPLPGRPPASASGLDADRLAFLQDLAAVKPGDLAAPVPGHGTVLSHGDFTPWNCLYLGRRLAAVLDWETLAWRPPGYDLVHHEVQRRVHFSARPLDLEVQAVVSDVPRWLTRLDESRSPWRMLHEYCTVTLNSAGRERWSDRGVAMRRALLNEVAARLSQ